MKEIIEQILAAAVNAPSGGNSQPWRFEIRGNEIAVVAEPEKDHPILNYRYRGTWLAHGALIENIKIAAAALGWRSNIVLFPDEIRPHLTARIKLFEAPLATETDLFQAIPQRATNRKCYESQPLTFEQKKYLTQSVEEIDEGSSRKVTVIWIEERDKIVRLGQVAAANEIITLENQKLHELFFDEIVWSSEEEGEKKQGLLVKTMELKWLEKIGLRLFKRWGIMKHLAKLGAARQVAASNSKNYAATPLMGLLIVSADPIDFILAGRIIERIWLKAGKFNCGFHLLTGTMFYWQRINFGGLEILSAGHSQLINREYAAAAEIAGLATENRSRFITAVFRLGPAVAPSARSPKKPPLIKWL